MKNNPKITVLMSVYNGDRYLKEAIDSILAQTFTDFEFLIIDDASTDGSFKIISEYTDNRLISIQNNNNLGLAKSLNIGVKIAKGEYIARMDADDVSKPERFEIQSNFLRNNLEIGVVGSWTEVIDEQGRKVDKWDLNLSSEQLYYLLHFKNCLTHSSVMIRKAILLEAGGYDESIINAQDFELWNRLIKVTKIAILKETLVKWRKIEISDKEKQKKQRATVCRVLKNNIEKYCHINIDPLNVTFIQNNFDNLNLTFIDKMDITETEDSLKILINYNQEILNNSPKKLNKQLIKWEGIQRFLHFIYILNFKFRFAKSIKFLISLDCNYFEKLLYIFILIKNQIMIIIRKHYNGIT